MPLEATLVNHTTPFSRHRADLGQGRAFDDMLRSYSPYGPVRTIAAPFRPGLGVGGYSGAADPYSLDYAISRQLELSGFQAGLDRQIYGGGKGLDLYSTIGSSVGEAVERMLGSFASLSGDEAEGRLTSWDRMRAEGLRCIGPDDLQMFLPSDFDERGFLFERWTPDTDVHWVVGSHLLDGEDVWVPAQFVHLFHLMRRGEEPVGLSSSGGLATHLDRRQAISHAVLELVERDAINIRWFSRLPPPVIELDRPFRDRRITEWLEAARRSDLHVEFYLQTIDVDEVHVVTAIAWDDELEEWSYFAGGGAALDVESAIRSAIAELIQSERMIRIPTLAPNWDLSWGIRRMFGSAADLEPEEFSNFIQVVPYYGHRRNRHKLDWYFRPADQVTVPLSSLRDDPLDHDEEYAEVLALCERHGFTPATFDMTPASFDQISLVKVVIPELVPAFAPGTPLLGHRRYREVPVTLGARSTPLDPADLTTDPLPYP